MKRLLLLLLTFVLSACSLGSKTELQRNRDKWESAGITHYRYSLFIGCFCAFRDKMPVTVEVRDGQVVSMSYQDGSPASPGDIGGDFFQRFSTIDQVFTELESGPSAQADSIEVVYDSQYGYPARITADPIENAIDDEYAVEISAFEILE